MTTTINVGDHAVLWQGDCLESLRAMPDASVDSVVTDPPYELGFMGKKWDSTGIANNPALWAEALRVLKPGGHLLAFGGTRTFHRMACAIEDGGFELRDTIGMPNAANEPHRSGDWGDCPWLMAWAYGSGFPKSLDVSKSIDKAAGAERTEVVGTKLGRPGMAKDGSNQSFDGSTNTYGSGGVLSSDITAPATEAARQWQGWGTALKPAWEPIVVARKPLIGTVAANVLAHGTGGLNIDGCRVQGEERPNIQPDRVLQNAVYGDGLGGSKAEGTTPQGRWPANLILQDHPEVIAQFPSAPGAQGIVTGNEPSTSTRNNLGLYGKRAPSIPRRDGQASAERTYADKGATNFAAKPGARREPAESAARFFASFKSEPCQHIESFQSPAHIAANSSSPPNQFDCIALERAVSMALPEGLRSSLRSLEPSTNATPSELRLIATSVIATIQSFAPRFWREPLPERLSLARSPVSIAISPTPTGTMTITASHWKSDGSVADATFDITQQSLEPGVKDSRQGLSSSRFMYCAKASARDRHEGLEKPAPMFTKGTTLRKVEDAAEAGELKGNHHPTVKPTDLMRYLCRLVTPPGGTVLDIFNGSGSTGKAAILEGFRYIGCEMQPEYVQISKARIEWAIAEVEREAQAARDAAAEPVQGLLL